MNRAYLESGELNVSLMGRGFAWLDTGTYDFLMEAGQFAQTIEHRQGLKVACLSNGYRNGWLSAEALRRQVPGKNRLWPVSKAGLNSETTP